MKTSLSKIPIVDNHPSLDNKSYFIGFKFSKFERKLLSPFDVVVLVSDFESIMQRISLDSKKRILLSSTLLQLNAVYMLSIGLDYFQCCAESFAVIENKSLEHSAEILDSLIKEKN